MTEHENVERIVEMLSKDFVCVVEDIENNNRILGKHHTGKNLFIDALIRPKVGDNWRNGRNTIFGIEFKGDYDKGGKLIKHIAQSIDYSQSDWYYNGKKIGKIPILIYPPPSQIDHPFVNNDGLITRILGAFNIGTIELSNRYNYQKKYTETMLQIRMSDASLYRSDNGPSLNALSHKLELKVGSR
jgi:hypothetical protein